MNREATAADSKMNDLMTVGTDTGNNLSATR